MTGVVRDAATTAPLAGVFVHLNAGPSSDLFAVTDATGGYRIDLIVPGSYWIFAAKTNYVPEYFDNVPCLVTCILPPKTSLGAGTTFVADFALTPLGSISGTVTDEQGNPLGSSAGTVAVFDAADQQIASTPIDSSGHYTFQNLFPGIYHIRVNANPPWLSELHNNIPCVSDDCRPRAGAPVSVQASANIVVDFALALSGSITGSTRRASDGTPVQTNVAVYNSAGARFQGPITYGAGGSFMVNGLAPGQYFVRAFDIFDIVGQMYGGPQCPDLDPVDPTDSCPITSGALVAVVAGQTTAGIDFSLASHGRMSGVVRDAAGASIGNGGIQVYAGAKLVGQKSLNADGTYEFSVAAGSYWVRTRTSFSDEWYDGLCVGCAGARTAVTVTAGQTTSGTDFDLAAGGAISGTYTCVDVPPLLNSSFEIITYSAHGEPVATNLVFCSSTPTVAFTVTGLPAGTYYLFVQDRAFTPPLPRGGSGTFIEHVYPDIPCTATDCDVRRGTPVVVPAGGVAGGIQLSIRNGATITGMPQGSSVFDARGVPLRNVLRRFIAGDYYEAVGLPTGTYFIKFKDVLYKGIVCPDCPATSGTPIVVASTDDRITIDHTTFTDNGPRHAITGRVRDAAGSAPLSMIGVQLFSAAGELLASDNSDVSGGFAFSGIAPGTYYVRTVNSRGYVDQAWDDIPCGACTITSSDPIVVTADAGVTGIDFLLSRGGVVFGFVTDEGGVPFSSAGVSIFDGSGALAERATTNEMGRYSVAVPPGAYRARSDPLQGRAIELYHGMPCPNGACDVSIGTPIPTDVASPASNINFTLAVCPAMTLSPAQLASGAVGDPYRQRFTGFGGQQPHRFSLVSGTLPTGVTLHAESGVLAGTPTQRGPFQFTIGAVDFAGCAGVRAYTANIAGCSFVLSPSSATVGSNGGSVTVAIVDGCGDRTVTPGAPWVVHDVAGSTPDQIRLEVQPNGGASPRSTIVTIGRRVFTMLQGGVGSQPPFGNVDTPGDGAMVAGAVPVSGWALDDLGVAQVRIYRDPVPPETSSTGVFLGNAVFVAGARPDVAATFPTYPSNDRAGWGLVVLTNMLPNQGNGTYRFYGIARDAEGHEVQLGSKTIVATNASATLPFGTIDTPGQGETIGGAEYLNFGWVLTPQPKSIPTDGSTLDALIDGAPAGRVTYGFFRPDVSGLFPGLANSDGPVGYRAIDTTALIEGLHTILWIARDNQGATAELGSRYFVVSNSSDAQPLAARARIIGDIEAAVPVGVPEGPDLRRRSASLRDAKAVDERRREIHLKSTSRFELHLEGLEKTIAACSGTWAGYLESAGELLPLPVGASLDRSGVFYWQPGPAFAGRFDLLFVRSDCQGEKARTALTFVVTTR